MKKSAGALERRLHQSKLQAGLGVNGINWTGIHTCSAINAGICRNNPLVVGFTDSVNWTGFVTGTTVNAFIGNGMSQDIHLLFS